MIYTRRLEAIMDGLNSAVAQGKLSRSAVELARFAGRMEERCPALQGPRDSHVECIMLSAVLLSLSLEKGHTCLSLTEEGLENALYDTDAAVLAEHLETVPGLARVGGNQYSIHYDILSKALIDSLQNSCLAGGPESNRPLILSEDRLYIHRYWSYEVRISERLLKNAGKMPGFINDDTRAITRGRAVLNSIFKKDGGPPHPDWQKVAAAASLDTRFLVISGGPGTGKTRTVAALMAVITGASHATPKIALSAPTGKAATRLGESVSAELSVLDIPEEIKNAIPVEAMTIHRLLGAGRLAGTFRFNAASPLPHDVIIVDEASMVDLPMMMHLVDALPEGASLVLLGDRDQLASVEAGSVLRDICAGQDRYEFSERFKVLAREAGEDITTAVKQDGALTAPTAPSQSALRDSIVTLTHNFRFREGSGIDELARAVKTGEPGTVLNILESPDYPGVRLVSPGEKGIAGFLNNEVSDYARDICSASSGSHALKMLPDMKILCGMRRGRLGVEAINSLVSMNVAAPDDTFQGLFKGLPVIIKRNDYSMELYNGDTGICWPDEPGTIKVLFQGSDNQVRSLSPSRLPAFEPAWAITVHSSQGSEFEKVLFILPPEDSPLLGRELLYTAITRARQEIVIFGTAATLKKCVERQTLRFSGLARLLW